MGDDCRRVEFTFQGEPIKRMRSERQHVRRLTDRRKGCLAEHFQRAAAGELRKIELDELHKARQVGHHQHALIFIVASKRQNLAVLGG